MRIAFALAVAGIFAAQIAAAASSPAVPRFAGAAVSPTFCFALNARFSDAIRQKEGRDTAESMAFARRANRIELALLEPFGDDDARSEQRAKLIAAIEAFDVKAFDALPEPEAEAIITHCLGLAGNDE